MLARGEMRESVGNYLAPIKISGPYKYISRNKTIFNRIQNIIGFQASSISVNPYEKYAKYKIKY